MRRMVPFTLLVVTASCLYTRGNIAPKKGGGYEDYPSSVPEEHERRRTRRRHALIAAPIEMVGGVALAALAIYGKSAPSQSSDSVTSNLADAGKQALGRILLASGGLAIATMGLGDAIYGLADPLLGSPIVREGHVVPESEIDTVDPDRGARLGFHVTNSIGTRGVGGDLGVGLAHWATPHVRLRYAAIGTLMTPYDASGVQLGAGGEITAEHAGRRRALGTLPAFSIGTYGGGLWSKIEGASRGIVRGGLFVTHGSEQFRLGSSYVVRDKLPSIDLSIRYELSGD